MILQPNLLFEILVMIFSFVSYDIQSLFLMDTKNSLIEQMEKNQ